MTPHMGTVQADLTLRGYIPIQWGALSFGKPDGQGTHTLYGAHDYLLNFKNEVRWQNYQSGSGDMFTSWGQRIGMTGPYRETDWDWVWANRRAIAFYLYRFVLEQEQCEHLSVVSPDGKRRLNPLRCTCCGCLVY